MPLVVTLATCLLAGGAAFVLCHQRALALEAERRCTLHSRPFHHGMLGAILVIPPGLVFLLVWLMAGNALVNPMVLDALPAGAVPADPALRDLFLNDVHNIAHNAVASSTTPAKEQAAALYAELMARGRTIVWLLTLASALLMGALAVRKVAPGWRARSHVERGFRYLLIGCSVVAIATTVGIVLSLLQQSLDFFARVSPVEFLFGLHWSPQTALRADQVGSSGAFGAVPLFTGTLLISVIAMAVAVPVGLMSAIYMTQYASRRVRNVAKPVLEILAGVPTVVYGFFAILVVAPWVREAGEALGLTVSSQSALAAGAVMGIMIIPFMSSLSDDAITAVPKSLSDGSLALGATKAETIVQVLIPAALPGIVGAFLLAISRAIGETMIVAMAAGLAANLTANPLEAVTTVTVQIVSLLTGDQEFDSAKTLSAFALGLVLFTVTLALNVVALRVVRKYRETYE
ncbi:phosphate ABC transporter permease subunit PstC [Rhodothalassium salexigens]|uniref:phosphate ABC transporter permease subunit PstC n=1 Tax=Rhodothalassium salexigens TaxID=1086 RepID=UPI0019118641